VLEGWRTAITRRCREAWERQFYIIALGHCEGPDHLARLDLSMKLAEAQKDIARPELLPMAERPVQQVKRVSRSVIERFGRHPHRNADLRTPLLGRGGGLYRRG
jgi:uncharacterized protein (DUF924 family)